jgi:hypothetical protein
MEDWSAGNLFAITWPERSRGKNCCLVMMYNAKIKNTTNTQKDGGIIGLEPRAVYINPGTIVSM